MLVGGNRGAAAGKDFEHAILFSSVGWVERGEGRAYKWRVIETGHGREGGKTRICQIAKQYKTLQAVMVFAQDIKQSTFEKYSKRRLVL